MDVLNWVKPQVLFVRLHDTRERGYREHVVTDDADRFVRFQRVYDAAAPPDPRRADARPRGRAALAIRARPADRLAAAAPLHAAHRPRDRRASTATSTTAHDDREVAYFVHDLLADLEAARLDHRRAHAAPAAQVWTDPHGHDRPGAKFIGPVWVGAGRTVHRRHDRRSAPPSSGTTPTSRPSTEAIQWLDIEPTDPPAGARAVKDATPLDRVAQARVRHRLQRRRHPAARCRSTRSSCWRSGSRTAGRSSSATRARRSAGASSAA